MRMLRHIVLLLAALAFAATPGRASCLSHGGAPHGHGASATETSHAHHAEAPSPCHGHHDDCGAACCGGSGLAPLVAESVTLDRRATIDIGTVVVGDDARREGTAPGLQLRPPKTA